MQGNYVPLLLPRTQQDMAPTNLPTTTNKEATHMEDTLKAREAILKVKAMPNPHLPWALQQFPSTMDQTTPKINPKGPRKTNTSQMTGTTTTEADLILTTTWWWTPQKETKNVAADAAPTDNAQNAYFAASAASAVARSAFVVASWSHDPPFLNFLILKIKSFNIIL